MTSRPFQSCGSWWEGGFGTRPSSGNHTTGRERENVTIKRRILFSATRASLAYALEVKPSKRAEQPTTPLGPQAAARWSHRPAQPPPAPGNEPHGRARHRSTPLSCSGSPRGGRLKAERWGMPLLLSAQPKDPPKIPLYKEMPGLQIPSCRPALGW